MAIYPNSPPYNPMTTMFCQGNIRCFLLLFPFRRDYFRNMPIRLKQVMGNIHISTN